MASTAPETKSELAQHLSQAGIDAEYWISILETKLGITLQQQIQYLDETDLKALKDYIRYGWEEKALRKFLGIESESTSNQATTDGKSEIVDKLTEAALDGKYWADVLKKKLGISRIEHISNRNIEDLKKLQDAISHDWEENALRNMFGISEAAYEVYLGKKQHTQTLGDAKILLREVAELRKKGIGHTDEMMNNKLDQLRQLMHVAKEQWVDKYDDKSLDDMISKMNSDLQDLGKLDDDRPVNSASEILANASAGLALRGILVGKAFSDDCVKRIVLSTPAEVKLMNPSMVQVDDVVHFSSKAQADHFHRSLDTMGYSFAAAVKGGRLGFEAEAGVTKKQEQEVEKESESYNQTHFESRVNYSVFPTAACELNPCSLKLSKQALKELKTIDRLLVGSNSQELACKEFVMSYGSHINARVIHFGGINKFEATYTSETKYKSDQTKSMVRDALSAYASASYSGFGFSVGSSISADHMNNHGSFTADYEKSEQAKTSLHTTRNGGPQEVSALPLWKMGLVTCNSTWALIDRGKTLSTDFVGIWELISNHKDEFQEPNKLASSLMTAWKKMTGLHESSNQGHTLINDLDEIDKLIDKVTTWNSRPLLPERCIEYLQEMLKTAEQAEGTIKYWEDKLCTEKDIISFLGKVVELKSQLDPKDVAMIRFLLRKLVKPVGFREFPGKQKIMNWAEVITNTVDIPSMLAYAGVESIPDLMRNINERFIPTLEIEHAKNTEDDVEISDSINAGATVDLALCMGQLLKNFQAFGESHKEFLLKVTLLSLHFHWPTTTFERLLTMKKLKNFVHDIEVLWKKFLVQQQNGKIQVEVFLIQTFLASSHFDKEKQSSEDEFSEITRDLRQVLSPELNIVLNRCTTRSPFKWDELTSITAELAKGNMSVVEERELVIDDLQTLFPSKDIHIQKKEPIKACKAGITAQGAQCAFLDILKILGLDKYYPCKISLLDAMVIKKVTLQPKLVDLPWMIIHKILMIDFNARDQILTVGQESEDGERHDNGDDFDLDDFLFEMHSSSDGEDKGTHLNTLDVLVVIFSCCDNFLKQTLAQKLFVCKLAIPFLYPIGSEGNVMMSLWALRTITLQWHTKQKEAAETPVTGKPFPLVTFVRLGRPPLSKSKLMNDILRDDSHDTFFNHDCKNGTVARRLTDGLVECSWFITAGKENEHLPSTTMLLNLRGDASSMTKQMQILQKISSVVFVIVTAHDLAKNPNTNTCRQILQTNENVILLLISGNNKQTTREAVVAAVKAVGKDLLKKVRIISSSTRLGNQKNASELQFEARSQLSEVISKCSGMLIEEFAHLKEINGVIIDEYDDEACVKGKVLAEKVLSHMKGKHIVDCKDCLLPLQGAEWIEYCKLLKKQHRTSGKGSQSSSAYQADLVKQEMDRLRKKQVKMCQNGFTPFIKEFMSTLQQSTDVALYFLKWMQMSLDEMSRANLPGLRGHYHTIWAQFQEAKKKHQNADMQDLESKVDEAERQLASASLGLENLFREIGQIYEAMTESGKLGKNTREVVDYLPEIAAKLLMNGIPLELVDGDASSVPISWVSAVLSKLSHIIGEKRLFVLSVLGIQSSGKSTLLNTMFGLQFTVSAGRCTRGAYMQLIPVDKHAELPFDYIVVVDTEGLRAPELGDLKHDHDNELATLVIGMGDVTMINIKGENTAELKDILQIVVHAFLRMNLVSKHIKDHRTCIFVHQNVPAANAKKLMMHGCQKLQEGLDKMAKEAAQSENIADIHNFSQIINFDIQKHVWYFSDLWHGNPPMAPANSGYSEQVAAVRSSLLGEIAKEHTTFLTTSDLSTRLADLWKGVVADDFVFSFRNSLELKAYNSLQSEYYNLEWKLQNYLQSWLHDAEIKLQVCEEIKDLEISCQSLIDELTEVLAEKGEEVEHSLSDYFQKSNLQDTIIQWQQTKLNQLTTAVEQQEHEGKKYLCSIKEARRVEILQSQKAVENEEHIMKNAVKLADKLKGHNVTDAQLEVEFHGMWVPMVNELATKSDDKELKMDLEMDQILHHRMHADRKILKDELRRNPLNKPFKHTSLEGSITVDDVRKEHISLKSSLKTSLKTTFGSIFASDPTLQARHETLKLTGNILRKINTCLKDRCNSDTKFQTTHATEIIQTFVEEFDNYNQNAQKTKDCTFTILPTYKIKLAVHVSRYCVQVFSLKQFEYNKKHGVKAKLEGYKNTAWSIFKNMVKQSTEEVIAGDILCTQLKNIIQKAVKKQIPRKCTDEALRDFQMTKYYLIVKMMDDLACKGNFRDYVSYINDAKEFALKWMTQYTNAKMFSTQDGSSISRYAELTESHIKKIVRCIEKSVEHATGMVEGQRGMRMALWIEKFCQRVSEEIAVPVSTLKQVGDRQVVDFRNLQRIILDQLDSVQAHVVKHFANETEASIDWDGTSPPVQIIDQLWGCPEQCPFCEEPCADTTEGHYLSYGRSHICMQHRPKGIGGTRWASECIFDGVTINKGQLNHLSCNYSIQLKNAYFQCSACNFKCREDGKCSTTETEQGSHEWLEYKTYLPTWDIAPDSTNSVSKYWMWFMTTYQSQLKEIYSAKLPEIPGSWMSITKDDALTDLRSVYK